MNRFLLLLSLMLTAILVGAQSEPEEQADVLEEIVVTARKTEVDLQDAPVAVSVVSGEDFDLSNVVKLDNFNGYAPGLLVSKNDGAGRVVSIRGIGWETAQNLSTQPSVLVYLDGVYLANPLALGLNLGEVERIDVLRGPQGTEFGQSTTGGAINIITRKPEADEPTATLKLEAGSYDLIKMGADVTVPVGNNLTFRGSVQKYDRAGFAEIKGGALDGYELDDEDSLTGHFSLNWDYDDHFSLRLSAFLHDADQHGAAQKHILDPNPDARELTQDYPGTFALENGSYSLIATWETDSGVVIRSLTGLQKLEKRQSMDGDRLTEELTSVNLTGFGAANFDLLSFWDNDSDAFSQELNISRRGEQVDWVVGAYYLDHENTNYFLEAVGPAPLSQFEDRLNNPGPETLPPFTPPLEFVEDRSLSRQDKAVFGQATWRFSERAAVTLGGRFQRDKSTDRSTQFWFIESEQVLEDDAFTWKLGLDLNLNEDHLLYGLISTGWKNGGNNPGALNGALDVPVNFEPEEVTAFEIGSRNTLLSDRLRINLTAFYYDYEQYQFIQEDPIPFSGGTGNIPEVKIYGVEGEFSGMLGEHLRLDGHVSAMDGDIDSDLYTLDVVDFLASGYGRFTETGVADRASLRVNLNGNEPPKLSDLTGRLLLSHNHAFDSGSVLTSRLAYIYRGEFQYRVFNNAVDTVPSYNTTNLSFTLALASLPLKATLQLSNLFDEDGVNSRFSNPFGVHTTSEEFIPPREIIASLRYTF